MLRDVINIIAENARQIPYFNKVYTIARRFRDGNGKVFPAEYTGSGNGHEIAYDKTGGMAYFRKNGNASLREDNSPKFTSCDSGVTYTITIPLKMVCFIPNNIAVCDDGFTGDEFAEKIISELTTEEISPNLSKLKSASLICTGYDTDSVAVLEKEYSNAKDITDMNYNNAYFSIDFNIIVVVDKTCLNECFNYGYNG